MNTSNVLLFEVEACTDGWWSSSRLGESECTGIHASCVYASLAMCAGRTLAWYRARGRGEGWR